MKRGISLIAVLMFMLAATAAGIVLFKWLGSENFSSAARLKHSEAYQASESGLDAVKSWLSFKAADVGWVLNEHLYTKQSYPLTNVVVGLGSSSKQNFKVYLIGADTATKGKPYKLKFMSIGKGRDDSEVRQTAIFSVEGLYSIDVPSFTPQASKKRGAKFEEDIWGNVSSFGILDSRRAVLTQDPTIKNAGGQALNTIRIGAPSDSGYLVLDGNYYVNGGMNIYGDVYSTGSFDFCPNNSTGDFIAGNLYVGGEFHPKGTMRIEKDAFLRGGVNPASNINDVNGGTGGTGGCTGQANGTVSIWGNSTIKKDFFYYNPPNTSGGNLGFHIGINNAGGNLVMDSIGTINLSRKCNNANTFVARGNVYIKNNLTGTIPSAAGCSKSDSSGAIPFFGEFFSKIVCVSGMEIDSGQYYHDYLNPKIKMRTNKTNQNISSCNYATWGADPLDGSKSDKDLKAKLEQGDGTRSCENTPIAFDTTIYLEAIKTTPPISGWVHRTGKLENCTDALFNPSNWVDLRDELQKCWNAEVGKGKYYMDKNSNEWLVVYIKDKNFFTSSGTLTSGKYIIILDVNPNIDNYELPLPPTGPNAEVMLYLRKGYPHKITLSGGDKNAKYNYFIFSDGDIKEFDTTKDGIEKTLTGNIFMNKCSILNTNTQNATLKTRGNETLIEDLIDGGILKETTFGSNSVSTSSSSGVIVEQLPDPYIIPLSPRLKVELESKYISKESEPENLGDAKKFILVMPRVVRLPPGTIQSYSDINKYYGLLYLNGADRSSASSTTQTPNSCKIGTTEIVYPDPAEGLYRCTFPGNKIGGIDASDFFMKIEESNYDSDPDQYSPGCTNCSSSSSAPSTNPPGVSSNSSTPPTVTCRLRDRSGNPLPENGTLNVTQGENINPPAISCSVGEPYSAILSASSGVYPNNSQNLDWQYFATYYGNNAGTEALSAAGNHIVLLSVYCDGTFVENQISCGTIKVSRPTCGIADGSNGGTVSVGQTIELNVGCGNATIGEKKFTASSGGTDALASNGNFACFNTPSSGTTPRKINLNTVSCDGHVISIGNSNPIPCGETGFLVQPASSTCFPSSSGSAPTITSCSFPYAPYNVYLGQNISAPEIECSNGEVNKATATFSASSGALPGDWHNWQLATTPAHYSSASTASNAITVSGVKCDDVLVSGSTSCGTINVCAHNRSQATTCDNFIGTLPASPNPPANPYTACFKHTNGECYVCKIDNEGNNNTCCSSWVWIGNQVDGNNLSKGYWYKKVDCPPSAPAPTITCNTSNLKACYATSGDPMPRPNVSCGSGFTLGATYFSIGTPTNPRSAVNGWENGGTNQMGSSYNNREIYLDRIICSDVEYNSSNTSSLPLNCGGTVNTGNCSSGGTVTVIAKDTEQTIAANGGTITIKCNNCTGTETLQCCRNGTDAYALTINNSSYTISAHNGNCNDVNTSGRFYRLLGSVSVGDNTYKIDNAGNLQVKCKFGY
jgi:hypothetical protein